MPSVGEPYFKRIFLFSLPLMLTSVLQMLYNAADLVVVGRFEGELALAAVGSTGALSALILNLFVGLSVGVGVCVAREIGAGDREAVSRTVHTSMLVAVVMGAVVAVVGYIVSPYLLVLMDTPDNVLGYAITYVRIIFIGSPASLLYNYAAAILRSAGDSKHPLVFLSLSGLANVILNVIFVAALGMGVAGVALATVLSQVMSAVLIIAFMMKGGGMASLSLKKLRIHGKSLGDMLTVGVPSGLQQSLYSFSNVIIQSSINSFGSAVMAGSAASGNIEGLFSVVYSTLGTAAITFMGQAVGAKRTSELKRILLTCLNVIFVCAAVLVPVSFVLRRPLLSLYASESEVMEAALVRFSVMLLPTVLCGIVDLGSGALRGIGYSAHTTVISLVCVFLFRWLWIAAVFPLFPNPVCVYLATVVSRLLNALFNYILLAFLLRKNSRLVKSENITEKNQ